MSRLYYLSQTHTGRSTSVPPLRAGSVPIYRAGSPYRELSVPRDLSPFRASSPFRAGSPLRAPSPYRSISAIRAASVDRLDALMDRLDIPHVYTRALSPTPIKAGRWAPRPSEVAYNYDGNALSSFQPHILAHSPILVHHNAVYPEWD